MSKSCCASHNIVRLRFKARLGELQFARRSLRTATTRARVRSSAREGALTWQSLYFDTAPPNELQVQASAAFFRTHLPRKSWVATEWRRDNNTHNGNSQSQSPSGSEIPSLVPEIAFLGRSNAGKSSLLNALLQSPSLCRVGPKPGKTIAMHAWTLSPSNPVTGGALKGNRGDTEPKLTVLDMPGYGHGSRTEWGQEIVTYLKRRKQLRRAMLLVNPLHGLKGGDEMILQLLRANGIVHQIVACKCDGVKPAELEELLTKLRDEVKQGEIEQGSQRLCLDDVLVVGRLGDGKMNKDLNVKRMLGLGDVAWTVLRACGLDEYAVSRYEAMEKNRTNPVQNKAGSHRQEVRSGPNSGKENVQHL